MIRSFTFSDGKLLRENLELEAIRLARADKGMLLWVDLENPTPDETKAVLQGVFEFHPLPIENCVTPNSLPKMDDYGEYLFIVAHALDFQRPDKLNSTELSFFLGGDYLVTFHTTPLRSVAALVERIGKNTGAGPRGPDRITHTFIDLLVESYAPVLDELRAEIEDLEERVLTQSSTRQALVTELLNVRGDLARLRTIVRPQRDLLDRLARGDNRLIRSKLLPYFRDLRDKLAQIESTAGGYQERLLMGFDIYLNRAGFETNEGIKFLTAITAIALPATVIGTWYGMNFENMPELERGYPWIIGVTVVTTILTVIYLKKRKWL